MQDREDFDVRSAAVKQLLTDHGQAMVHAAINACVFCLPSYMIPDVAEVLYELMIVDRAVSYLDMCTCVFEASSDLPTCLYLTILVWKSLVSTDVHPYFSK